MLSRFLTDQRQRAVPSHGRSSDRLGKLAISLMIKVDAVPGRTSIETTRGLRSKCDRDGGSLDVCPRLTQWQTLLAVNIPGHLVALRRRLFGPSAAALFGVRGYCILGSRVYATFDKRHREDGCPPNAGRKTCIRARRPRRCLSNVSSRD